MYRQILLKNTLVAYMTIVIQFANFKNNVKMATRFAEVL